MGRRTKQRRDALGAYLRLSPLFSQVSLFILQIGSHLAMGSGNQQDREGTLLGSGLLLLLSRCAQGMPGGLLGGSHSLLGSSGQQDKAV